MERTSRTRRRPLWPWLLAAGALELGLFALFGRARTEATFVAPADAPRIQVAVLRPPVQAPEVTPDAAPPPQPTPEPPRPEPKKAIRPAPEPPPPAPVVEEVEPVESPVEPVLEAREAELVAEEDTRQVAALEASVAPAPAAPSPDEIDAYLERIRRAIDAKKRYPAMARRRGTEGDVRIQLRIEADGSLTRVEVVSGSARVLVPPTEKAARAAAPFPPPPMGPETIEIVVRYAMDE